MSYSLVNYPLAARRHNRSYQSYQSYPSGILVNTTLTDLQKREFAHLILDSLSMSLPMLLRPPPNYSIVPSTIKLEGEWTKPHLETFPRFQELPPELRTKVYKYACLEPRVVPIWPVVISRTPILSTFHFESETPAIMQVSREARSESQKLKIYQGFGRPPFPAIWIKPNLDIICPVQHDEILWTGSQFLKFARGIAQMQVQRLALNSYASPAYRIATNLDEWHNFCNFPAWLNQHLREIYLYSSTRKNDIRCQSLQLVEATDLEHGPEEWTDEHDTAAWRADMKFARLSQMIADLSFYRTVQERVDRMRERDGQESQIQRFMPRWLYDARRTWIRPELKRLCAVFT
ncbi:hypothetical protein EYC80_010197 [Monilinia laxa]|uniref:2EXR domain-containing protein n=1 Tax=Monilinia laxa TaxID=61186 RepID=A0A5N6JPI5_MONLA|nr:hypothetical protein EYC80_010197 [Monilinia laxa]